MALTRINHFKAIAGQGTTLLQALQAVVPSIQQSAGCLSCRAVQHEHEAEQIVVLEEWADAASHQAALQSVPQEVFMNVMLLLAEPPQGAFYQG